jgi:hypothetical protein
MFGPVLGRGTILRGAGGSTRDADVTSAAGCEGGVAGAGRGATGVIVAAAAAACVETGAVTLFAAWTGVSGAFAGATGVADRGRAASSASSLRRWMAFITSPGFDTLDQSILGFGSGSAFEVPLDAGFPPRWKCRRTRSASSASSELEWVFFSMTPTASSESRIALLLTSSSRAKSLIRTLLIRPFMALPNRPSAHSNLLAMGVNTQLIIP